MTTSNTFASGWLRRGVVGSLLTLALLGVSACGGTAQSSSSPVSPENPVKVRIGKLNPINSPELVDVVATKEGFFREVGIEPEVVGATDMVSAMLAGDLDVAAIGVQGIISSSQGRNVTYLAGTWQKPTMALLVKPNSPLVASAHEWRDVMEGLKGKQLGVTVPGQVIDNLARSMAQSAGLTPGKDISVSAAGNAATLVANLEAGTYDAALVPSPIFETVLERKSAVSVLDVYKGEGPAEIVSFPYASPATTPKFLKDHPGFDTAYRAAITKAIAWMKDPANKGALLDILSEETDTEPAKLEAQLTTILGVIGPIDYPKSLWDSGIKVLEGNGLKVAGLKYEDHVVPDARG